MEPKSILVTNQETVMLYKLKHIHSVIWANCAGITYKLALIRPCDLRDSQQNL